MEFYPVTGLTIYFSEAVINEETEMEFPDAETALQVLKELELGNEDFILVDVQTTETTISQIRLERSLIIGYTVDRIRNASEEPIVNDLCSVEI